MYTYIHTYIHTTFVVLQNDATTKVLSPRVVTSSAISRNDTIKIKRASVVLNTSIQRAVNRQLLGAYYSYTSVVSIVNSEQCSHNTHQQSTHSHRWFELIAPQEVRDHRWTMSTDGPPETVTITHIEKHVLNLKFTTTITTTKY